MGITQNKPTNQKTSWDVYQMNANMRPIHPKKNRQQNQSPNNRYQVSNLYSIQQQPSTLQ
jgi:hypothetical protein